ncbi:hypothetical protein MIR68_003822 [Amoeboaphelidium protococcarum]|nr:hypothetical protein MIR68_003822 [Amoeboaphelidium protococcarum]
MDAFQQLFKFPYINGAHIVSSNTNDGIDGICISVEAQVKCLQQNKKLQFTAQVQVPTLDRQVSKIPLNLNQVSSDLVCQSWSPSRKMRCVLKETSTSTNGGKKRFVELWTSDGQLQRCIEVTTKHGAFSGDSTFGGYVTWNREENRVAYVAERLSSPPSSSQAADRTSEDNIEDYLKKYQYKQDWGEKFDGKSDFVIVVIDLTVNMDNDHSVKVLQELDKTAGQPQFGRDDSLIFRTVQCDNYKYGIVYCHNRPGALWSIDRKYYLENQQCGNVKCLSTGVPNARSVRVAPSQEYCLYLSNQIGGGHFGACQLIKYNFSTGINTVIVDVVQDSKSVEDFPGLYTESLPLNCFLNDNLVLVNTQWRDSRQIVLINIYNGSVTPLYPQLLNARSSAVLDLCGDVAIVQFTDCVLPNDLSIVRFNPDGIIKQTVKLEHSLTLKSLMTCNLPAVKFEVQSYPERAHQLETIYMYQDGADRPCIIYPHGGPNSAFAIDFNLFAYGFCLMGFNVALVNYTGSVGYGQVHVDQLLGRIGELDIGDVHYVSTKLSASKYYVFGGSHGGFIGGHLMGQFPEFYSAAVLRNPVLNVATNLVQSDIPDWSYMQGGLDYRYQHPSGPSPTPEHYKHLYERSPIQTVHRVKKPIMFLLGSKDRRVPNYEGLNWYHYLKGQQDSKVECLVFPEDNHSLDSVDAEWTCFHATVDFFKR